MNTPQSTGRFEPSFAIVASLTSIVLGLAYAMSSPTSIQGADAAYFMLLTVEPGVAHPSGYPLFTWVARVVTRTGLFASATTGVALASALFAILGAILQLRVLWEAWPSARWFGGLSILAIYLSSYVWSNMIVTEPFGLNALLIGWSSYLTWRILNQVPGQWSGAMGGLSFCLGLCFGLGFANHHTLVLFSIGCAWAIFYSARLQALVLAKMTACFSPGFVIGSLPILALWHAPGSDQVWTWPAATNLSELRAVLLREVYGTFQLTPQGAGSSFDSLLAFVLGWPGTLSFALLAVVVIGGIVCIRAVFAPKTLTGIDLEQRMFSIGTGLTLLSTLIFLASFNVIINHASAQAIVERFFYLPMLTLPWPMMAGWTWLAGLSQRPGYDRMLLTLAGIAVLGHGVWQYSSSDRSMAHRLEYDSYQMVRSLHHFDQPVVIATADSSHRGLQLAARKLRADREPLVVLVEGLWPVDSYREYYSQRLGLNDDTAALPFWQMIRTVQSERPVFLDFPIRRYDIPDWYVLGHVLQLVPPGESMPSFATIVARNEAIAEQLLPPYSEPARTKSEQVLAERWHLMERMLNVAKQNAQRPGRPRP